MIRSILADIGKLWQYYPFFSPHHPRQSILNWQLSIPGFLQRPSVKQSGIFQHKNSWDCCIKMEIRKPQQHFRYFVLCLAGISPSPRWCHWEAQRVWDLYCPISREKEGEQGIKKLLFHLSSVISEFSSQVTTCCSFQSYLLQKNT